MKNTYTAPIEVKETETRVPCGYRTAQVELKFSAQTNQEARETLISRMKELLLSNVLYLSVCCPKAEIGVCRGAYHEISIYTI